MPPKTRERPRTASVIAGNAFYGSDELTRENLEELRYQGVQGAVEGLITTWNGGLIGMVAVELSPDNSRTKDAHFVLAGTEKSSCNMFSLITWKSVLFIFHVTRSKPFLHFV